MLFYTPVFLVFSTVLLSMLGIFHKNEPRKLILLIASYIFYMWWNPAFILLIIISTVIDYVVGGKMSEAENPGWRKTLLIISMSSNLGMLIFFKYAGLLSDSLLGIMRLMGHEPSWVSLNITLPVGISFYTFQTMSYTIDIYRKEIKATKNPLDFALFVAFFPQLVAGPIVRAATFLPQLTKDVRISCDQTTFFLIIRGLAKKVLIADNLAIFIDPVFSSPGSWPSIIIWLATIAFAIQIYCDFSGYSDIAIGIARILGFTLPQNFNHPYSARNPSDFWERWHISLSSWLRDYLYISLGGNRGSAMATYRNLMLTMLLGGLWHGASWNFLIWGLLHGSILVAHRLYTGLRKKANPEWRAGKGLFTYLISLLLMQYFVMLTWISFRLTDFGALQTAMHKFVVFDFDFDLTGIGLGNLAFFSSIALMAIFILFTIVSQRTGHIENYLGRLSTAKAAMVCFISGFVFYYLWPLTQAPFIYFQF